MLTVSTLTVNAFVVLVVLVAVLVVVGLRRAGWRRTTVFAVCFAYVVIPGFLARAGALDRYSPPPAPALLILFGLTVATISLSASPLGARVAATIPVAWVVVLQSFRIPVEWLLHRLYVEGGVPVEMTYSGRNWDVVSGVSGLALGLWLLSGRRAGRGVVLGWNLLGLGLLLNIVTIAILAAPGPLRQITTGPPNLLPSTFPFVWLPSFLVQLALASHLLVFRQLRRRAT